MGCMSSRQNVPIPWVLSSYSKDEWLQWRRCFLTYVNCMYMPPYKQTRKFFKYTGYVGEEISNSLYFQEPRSETKLEILIFKFNVHFIFEKIERCNGQDLNEYVASLKEIAEKTDKNSVQKIVKEKILQDFMARNLFQQLKNTSLYSRINNFEGLALHELIFLWAESEKPGGERKYLEDITSTSKRDFTKNRCSKCNYLIHQNGKCYALGKICYKCGEFDHFARCCPRNSVMRCSNCGSSYHFRAKCPNFTERCLKCTGEDPFSGDCSMKVNNTPYMKHNNFNNLSNNHRCCKRR